MLQQLQKSLCQLNQLASWIISQIGNKQKLPSELHQYLLSARQILKTDITHISEQNKNIFQSSNFISFCLSDKNLHLLSAARNLQFSLNLFFDYYLDLLSINNLLLSIPSILLFALAVLTVSTLKSQTNINLISFI